MWALGRGTCGFVSGSRAREWFNYKWLKNRMLVLAKLLESISSESRFSDQVAQVPDNDKGCSEQSQNRLEKPSFIALKLKTLQSQISSSRAHIPKPAFLPGFRVQVCAS